MATEGRVSVATNTGRYVHTVSTKITSQDPIANTTTVYYSYDVHGETTYANGAWTTLNDVTFTATINGVAHSFTPNFDFRTTRDWQMIAGYQTITNNPDGSLDISMSLAGTANPGSVYFTAVSAGPVTYASTGSSRASTVSVTPNPVVSGGTVTINMVRSVGTYTHDITWVSGGSSGTVGTGVGTSTIWTPSGGLLGGANSVPITITVQTKNGATLIGLPVKIDLIMVIAPVYPTVGVGTPYDLRFKRTELSGGVLVVKEVIPFLDAKVVDTQSATATCTLSVSELAYPTNLDEAVVVADVYDGSQWIDTGMLFVLTRTEGDVVDNSQTNRYTGMAYVDYILSKGIVKADLDWPVTTPGDVIATYMTQGQARGWGVLLGKAFSKTVTTIGTPWQNTTTTKASKGTPISQLLDGFVGDVLCEYRTHFNKVTGLAYLDIYNPGYGADWTVPGSNPVVNIATAALYKVADTAPVRKDFSDKLTRVLVEGSEVSTTRERASAVNPVFGHLEGSVSASGVTVIDKLNAMGDASLNAYETATIERTYSYDLSSAQTPDSILPYRTFRPGDWILVPGSNAPERVRVSQVAITRGAEKTTATITVGDMIPSGIAAIARKQTQAGGGAIAGGTLLTPLPLSSAIPAAPTGLTTNLAGFWDTSGAPKSSVDISWNPVTVSLNGNNIPIDLYEVWTRPSVGLPWALAFFTTTTTGTISPLNISSPLDIYVRARSNAGIFGPYSDFVSVTTIQPTTTLSAPTSPPLTVDGLGVVKIAWNGLIGGAAPPLWFNYVQAEISSSSGGAYTIAGNQLTAAGSISVAGIGAGTWWFRLVGYDTLNVRGTASAPTSIVVVPYPVDLRTPKTPTGVSTSSLGYFNGPTAMSSLTVSWTAVTQATDNSVMTMAVYEVWGKLSTDTTYRLLGSVVDPTITVQDMVPAGATFNVKVRAIGANLIPSAYTSASNQVLAAAAMLMDQPTAPTLTTQSGLVIVTWDGSLLNVGTGVPYVAPVYVANVNIQVSVDAGVTYSTIGFLSRGNRAQSVSGVPVGSTARVRLVAVDVLGQSSAPSTTSDIVVLGYAGADIIANSITGNKITAGTIGVVHVQPSFGNDLDISANGTVSIISGQVADAQADADSNTTNLAAMRTRYDFTPSEAVISQPGSVFQVAISNTQLEFRESGVAKAYLNAGIFYAPQLASGQVILGAHIIRDDPGGTGTVINRR